MQEMQETRVPSLGWEEPLEEERATPASILSWKIPCQRNLEGYSPGDCKESDTTEHRTVDNFYEQPIMSGKSMIVK